MASAPGRDRFEGFEASLAGARYPSPAPPGPPAACSTGGAQWGVPPGAGAAFSPLPEGRELTESCSVVAPSSGKDPGAGCSGLAVVTGGVLGGWISGAAEGRVGRGRGLVPCRRCPLPLSQAGCPRGSGTARGGHELARKASLSIPVQKRAINV